MEKFEEHDSAGIGMAISAMSVVFSGLILLYISFKIVGKISVNLSKRNAMRVKGITDKRSKKATGAGSGRSVRRHFYMAMHEFQSDVHDVEDYRTYHYTCETQLFAMEFKDLHAA